MTAVEDTRFLKAILMLKKTVYEKCILSSLKFMNGKGCTNCPFEQDGYCSLRIILSRLESKDYEKIVDRKIEEEKKEEEENNKALKIEIIEK